jgi:biopolymer transport protein ExbB
MTTRLSSMIAALTLAATLVAAPNGAFAQAASAPEAAPATTASAPAAEPAPAAPPPLVATTTKETVENPYGLQALWAQGDFVAKGTLMILVIMSLGSWYILVTKLYESVKISGEARAARDNFSRKGHASSRKAAPSASSPKPASTRASTTRAR